MEPKIISKVFEQHNIRQRETDGYFSATDMCRAFGKSFGAYKQNKTTYNYIAELSKFTGIQTSELIEINKAGSQYAQGTWVHPQVATHLAMWISPKFAIYVTLWIEEQKRYSLGNTDKYNHEINHLEPSPVCAVETKLRDELAIKFGAKKEVPCASGRIDLVTADQVIEIKHISKWKHALGQVLAYALDTGLKPAVYLFDNNGTELISVERDEIDKIKPYFDRHGIEVLN